MSDRLFLVRHGEAAASWGEHPDPPLSDLGRRQADAVARQLSNLFDDSDPFLVSSPLRRAQETAEPLAGMLKREITVEAKVREVPAPVPLAQRQDWLRQFMTERWSTQSPDVLAWRESVMDFIGRLQGSGVVFTHFLVINAVVASLEGREETLAFWPANASVTTLAREGGRWTLAELGEQMMSRVG